jgi:hypothetical protein
MAAAAFQHHNSANIPPRYHNNNTTLSPNKHKNRNRENLNRTQLASTVADHEKSSSHLQAHKHSYLKPGTAGSLASPPFIRSINQYDSANQRLSHTPSNIKISISPNKIFQSQFSTNNSNNQAYRQYSNDISSIKAESFNASIINSPSSILSSKNRPAVALDLAAIYASDEVLSSSASLIQQYQAKLEQCYESGEEETAGEIASKIAREKKSIKQRRIQIEILVKQRQLEINIVNQLSKQFQAINIHIIDRAIEIERIKANFRNILIPNKLNLVHNGLKNLTQYYDLLNQSKREIKENQDSLEQECATIDSIDLSVLSSSENKGEDTSASLADTNGIAIDLNLLFPDNQLHLANFNKFHTERSACIEKIRQQLAYLIELQAHLTQFHVFIQFLVEPTPFLQQLQL